ncbi:MAG: hypothetical protein Q9187_000631 [Circinaria calcarea]
MTNPHLPTPRAFITSLFKQLKAQSHIPTNHSSSSSFISSGPALRNLFLTLHCLFPNELLPALDLLDRSLVTRLLIEPARHAGMSNDPGGEIERDSPVYYVRSAQTTRSSRYQSAAAVGGLSYEVRPGAWNCSCPAFTFSALNGVGTEKDEGMGSVDGEAPKTEGEWKFGGLLLGEDGIPICKHLLSCVLIENCGLFAACGDEKAVTREDFAGWAAGWGG